LPAAIITQLGVLISLIDRHGGSVELHQEVGQVKSKEDLAAFVAALRLDLAANPEEWENPTLEGFLEAMEAWIRDMDAYFKNMGQPDVDVPSWRTLADILYASKIYE
jgi:hypothetical protein